MITSLKCTAAQHRHAPTPYRNNFQSFIFPPTGTSYKIHKSRQSGYSDRYKNLRTRSVSMNLSACCFHLGVTSIICQSCPPIVTKEKEDGSLWRWEMCRLVRWLALETCLRDQSKWEGKLFQGLDPLSLRFAFCCSICCVIGDSANWDFDWAYKQEEDLTLIGICSVMAFFLSVSNWCDVSHKNRKTQCDGTEMRGEPSVL